MTFHRRCFSNLRANWFEQGRALSYGTSLHISREGNFWVSCNRPLSAHWCPILPRQIESTMLGNISSGTNLHRWVMGNNSTCMCRHPSKIGFSSTKGAFTSRWWFINLHSGPSILKGFSLPNRQQASGSHGMVNDPLCWSSPTRKRIASDREKLPSWCG